VNELDLLIDKLINENKEEIMRRREKAFNYVMGKVMDQVRGKIDGKIVAERVREKLKSLGLG